MDYKTIEAASLEEALTKARKLYGNRVRIQSKRDISKKSFLGGKKYCELTFYLADIEEEPKKEPEVKADVVNASEQDSVQETDKVESVGIETKSPVVDKEQITSLLNYVEEILRKNEFSDSYVEWCKKDISEQFSELRGKLLTEEELELMLADKISESFEISTGIQKKPARICVVVGCSGSGKTTSVAKLAATYSSYNREYKRNVRIVTLDDNPSILVQFRNLGKVLDINIDFAKHESDLSDVLNQRSLNELILVDTIGKPLNTNGTDYALYGLMNVADQNVTDFMLVVPATMKNSDIETLFELYKPFHIKGIIATKIDETSTIGNIISASHDRNIPLLFAADGKKIPADFKLITIDFMLKHLKGFKINFDKILAN